MATVTLDAGHGGYDSGATYNGRREKDDNLNIVLAVGELLEQNGVDVGYTRVTDVYDSPLQKARIANEQGSEIFVSIHRNSSPNANTYSGVETLLYDEGGVKEEMANAINRELAEAGFPNLGINIRKDLAVLRRTQMPALLVEVGFLNTDADNTTLDQNFDAVARAIANGIYETLMGAPLPATGGTAVGQTNAGQSGGYTYRVQTGLFRNRQNAENMAAALNALGIPSQVLQTGEYYAVQAGNEATLEEGAALENELRQLGYDTLLVAV